MVNGRKVKIDEKNFDLIHALRNKGVIKAEIARILGLSESSVSRVLYHSTYEDFDNDRNKLWGKENEKGESPKTCIVSFNQMQELNSNLIKIGNKLSFVEGEIASIHQLLKKYMEV